MFRGKRGQQSFLVIIFILIIILIVVLQLGEFFGASSDAMCSSSLTGLIAWFFCNWIEIIFLVLFVWILWMVFKG